MSDPIEISLDGNDGHLVEPPIIDLLYVEPQTNSYIITFVPEQAVSSKGTESVDVAVDSEDGRRINVWMEHLGTELRLGGSVQKIVHRGGGDFTFTGVDGDIRQLSSPDLPFGTPGHVYVALQDLGQVAQIAFLTVRRQPQANALRPRVLRAETRDGRPMRGTAEGNNASWMCVCGYAVPLIGTTRVGAGDTQCPNCGRLYRVYPFPHKGEKVDSVKEIEPSRASA